MIERLEIEFLSKFYAKAVVFQNQSGEIVTLAHDIELHRDGFALGSVHYEEEEGSWIATVEETEQTWCGYPFQENGYVSKEKIELSKDEWEKVLETGDPVIRIHIPPFGKMTTEMIDKTIEETKKFAKEHFVFSSKIEGNKMLVRFVKEGEIVGQINDSWKLEVPNLEDVFLYLYEGEE